MSLARARGGRDAMLRAEGAERRAVPGAELEARDARGSLARVQ